jgi:hypothetical protein
MSWPRIFGPGGATAADRVRALRTFGPQLSVILSNPYEPSKIWESTAVIDSGASCICIGRRLARELSLERTGLTRMVAVGAEHPAGTYAAIVKAPELDFQKFLPVVAPDGVHTSVILLGRSFLEFFDFTYNGPTGTFTFHRSAIDSSHTEFDE